jgi:cobalt-zinc-cadmium efflux system protein
MTSRQDSVHPHAHHVAGDGHGHAGAAARGHSHGPGHAHGIDAGAGDFSRAFLLGIVFNTLFVAVEAFYGWRVDSLALLADAGHNLSDVAGLAVAWGGARAAGMRPTDRHTYGWKRASILAAFANAVLLLVAMGSLAWEAIGRLSSPQPVQGTTVMVVAAIGIVVNLGTALLFVRGRKGDLNVRGAFLHMAGDALVSAGVVVAGGLAVAFGWNWLDPVTSLAIALLIVLGTWGLFRHSLHLLFDGVPEGIELHAVRRELEELPGVQRVHDLHVWATGTTETALTAHLVMPEGHPDDRFFEAAARRLEARFGIGHATLQVVSEPVMASCDAAGGVAAAPAPGAVPSREPLTGRHDR